MGSRGELLALVESAPGPLRTLQGALTTWTHRARVARVHERVTGQPVDGVDDLAPVAPLATLPGAFGWDDEGKADDDEADDDHDGDEADDDEGLAAAPAAVAGTWPSRRPEPGEDAPETMSSWYVAVALPDRWRVVGRGHLAVSDGRRSWAGTSTLVTERDSTRAAIHDAGAIGACLYPEPLLKGLDLAAPQEAEVAGRRCWLVDARTRADATDGAPVPSAMPHPLRIHRDLVGLDHRIWLEATTGILLRHEGFVDGEMCSSTQLTDLVFDAPLADDEFRPPPGAVVRSRHELLRDHLSEMGVDPDTVDLDDPAQVREALRQGG